MTRTKSAQATIKAVGAEPNSELEEGQFRALVSVFGNVDSYGDVVMPGAFTDTLAAWEKSGDPIPVIWTHKWDDPFAHIGHVVKATETADGLEVVGQIDLDEPYAAKVYSLLKGRRINQFSFAFDVDDGGWGERKADGDDDNASSQEVYELRKLSLHEVGPCLLGVNRATELRDIKAAQAEQIRDIVRAELAKTTGAPAPASKGTSSQVQEPRDDTPAPNPGKSDPPRLNPASVHALLTTHLPEGV